MLTAEDCGIEVREDLGERLELLRDSAKRFSDRPAHIARSRRLRGHQPGYDREVWREFANLGWLGARVPESFGGLGLGCTEIAVIAEELSSALSPEPFPAAVVLAGGCSAYGDNENLKAELLPTLVTGDLIPALAWREDQHDGNPLAVSTRAEEMRGGVKLFGVKRLVIAGASADGVIVSARTESGAVGLYWVRKNRIAGATTYKALPDGREMADIVFDGVEVPNADVLASPDVAEGCLMRAYDDALVVTSAELIGVCEAVFALTLDYLRTRVQFGKPIGSFQSLQHRAADIYIQLRMCRHTLDEVLATVVRAARAREEVSAEASRVKARCSDASLLVTREAVQMHGAMGYSDECDVGLYLKRAITLSSWLGGADFHRKRYGKLALGLPACA